MMKRLLFFLCTSVALLTGCSDDDSFSSDSGYRLSFSTDTVRIDTLFSNMASTTSSFWVHNRTGKGLHITTVRLERGNQSGFRVNADGVFLNPTAVGLEVRSGDSLRVFVEVTTRENSTNDPTLVEDNLLFTLESGVEQRVNLRTYSWNADKVSDLVIARDTTIQSVKPVVFYGNGITVSKGATLTLKNTTLFFHDEAGIDVDGRLVAEGCTFRGDRLDHMFDYLPYDRISGQWRGIEIHVKSNGCQLTNCEVRNAYDGVCADSTTVTLTNTVIHNCRGNGLYAHDCRVRVDGCQLTNTLGDCLWLKGGVAEINQSTLAQFYPFSGDRAYALHFMDTEELRLTLSCTNTLVTGYAEDVVMGENLENEETFYLFENCLLRTPEVEDKELFGNVIWETSKDEVQGKDHFVLIDEENLAYDFTIKAESPAYEKKIGRAFAQPAATEQ